VINAGAGWASKRWPTQYFAKLIDGLEAQAQAVLIGGNADADRSAADEVIAACACKPIDLVGKTGIKELIGLISLAKAHLGGDTGSTHIAAALGIPAIGLYSITRPKRSCPYGQIERCHYDPDGLDRVLPGAVLSDVLEAISS
jgi:ADP-heptose:LPS heptosyltransferase